MKCILCDKEGGTTRNRKGVESFNYWITLNKETGKQFIIHKFCLLWLNESVKKRMVELKGGRQ